MGKMNARLIKERMNMLKAERANFETQWQERRQQIVRRIAAEVEQRRILGDNRGKNERTTN